MDITILKETRPGEHRAALTPSGVSSLVRRGHRLWVEHDAGAMAGHPDADYQAAGATVAYGREEAIARGEVVVCVFPPEPSEHAQLLSGQTVFAFWALPAGRREDVVALQEREVTAIGLEVVADAHGHAPVLKSMSEIAGGLAVTIGGVLLLSEFGGKGLLMGGAPGVPPAHIAILGAGVLGRAAARAALGAGAQVMLLDSSVGALREALFGLGPAAATMLASPPNIEKALGFADLLLCAAATRGERAPLLVPRGMLRLMKPRSVVMDLSIDMGGCVETSRPTAFPDPVFEVDGVLHFCVPNLPAVAARASSLALTNALLPYLEALADGGLEGALASHDDLRRGVYLYHGRCTHPALARAFELPLDHLSLEGPR